jgi:heme exporter protein CcmD
LTHLAYIAAAYLASGLVLAGLTAWVILDLREQKRRLQVLEEKGLRRSPETPR